MSERRVTFFFENRPLEGIEGEPIAKALFSAGVRTLSWSVKYKRPRSLHCARGRCIMCHMEVDGAPGVPTCIAPLADGMRVRRENFRPFFAPLLVWAARAVPFPAGFYYRMFTRPGALRRLFLGTLRRMAGVGRLTADAAKARPAPPLQHLEPLRATYDVVVVGAGLSGMAAAASAARNGADVLLIDEYAGPGGHSQGFQSDAELAAARDRLGAELSGRSLTYRPGIMGLAFYEPDRLLVGPGGAVPGAYGRDEGLSTIRARTFVFATGAYDVVPVFENNDLPGIFGSRAIRLLLERDGLRPGSRAVLYGLAPALDETAALLEKHGIAINAVVDAGSNANTGRIHNTRVARAHGRSWLSGITVRNRRDGGSSRIRCDLLCTAFPGQGAYELAYQGGFRFAMSNEPLDENRVMLPTEERLDIDSGATLFVVGELAGERQWREKIAKGERAGERAVTGVNATPRARESR
jgi:sarcosine oxidase subunit alpha